MLHKKIAKFFGYNLVKFHKLKLPTAESAAVNIIDRYGVNLVLDVGANAGQYATTLRAEGYRGCIHSFEPVADAFSELSQACKGDANWTAHQIALGAARTTKTINLMRGKTFHSFYQPNDYGKAAFSQAAITDTQQVNVSTVDDFLKEGVKSFSGKKVFLKMDTQGHDLEVFAGAGKSLGSIVAIQSEMAFKPIYADVPSYADALKVYESAGFKVAGFYPVSTDKNLTIIEMD